MVFFRCAATRLSFSMREMCSLMLNPFFSSMPTQRLPDQESKLAELKAEAKKAEKEVKRFKQRKKAHENRLQNLNQEIANKDPMAEAVRTARFQATQDIGIQSLTVVACKQRVFEFFLLSSFSFVIVLQPFFE